MIKKQTEQTTKNMQNNPEDKELPNNLFSIFCLVMQISVDELTKVRICLETHLVASNHM